MYFQTLDNKNGCVGLYVNGALFFDKFPKKMHKFTHTWDYAQFLSERDDIEYAQLYVGGKKLKEICPKALQQKWELVHTKLRSFARACLEARVDLREHCFYMMVPSAFLVEYCEIKEQICTHVFSNYERPKNYEFLLNVQKLITDIRYQPLNLSTSKINEMKFNPQTKPFIKKVQKTENYIDYNPWTVKTGRLSTNSTSFPALTFDRRARSILEPTNDVFLELDYNAAELRVFLALLGQQAPDGDMYNWLGQQMNIDDRGEVKKIVLPWFYSPDKSHNILDSIFDREKLTQYYWDGEKVETIFEREIQGVDKHHALNYTVQSTASDIVLEQACDLRNFLKDKKSFITMMMHDAVVIDLSKEDREHMVEIKKIIEATRIGTIPTTIAMGKDYGNMEKLTL